MIIVDLPTKTANRPWSTKVEKSTLMESNLSQCQDCGHLCCKYITVKIPAPRTICDFDGLLWQLAHQNVKAYRDSIGWHLLIYNPCMHLKDNGRCAIYAKRPITCRQHSIDSCEYDNPIDKASIKFFDSYKELNSYCKRRFKTWERRF